ncbi:MAG: hypothetical protein JNL04_02895 [Rhodospirillaceae bacterium]|nr:hypothetical protein [Rhodospirillaceae bacterium]
MWRIVLAPLPEEELKRSRNKEGDQENGADVYGLARRYPKLDRGKANYAIEGKRERFCELHAEPGDDRRKIEDKREERDC